MRNIQKLVFVLLVLLAGHGMSHATDFKRVSITDTDNYVTPGTGAELVYAPKADQPLLDYVFTRLTLTKSSDPEVFITAMEWVSSQWKHDGMNEAPSTMTSLDILKKVHSEGTQYRCVEYGKVLTDLLSAMGYQSRQVGLQSVDVAYGGWGRGHVATEVWSNRLQKWVFLDPQFSTYAVHHDEYLNLHDIYLLKRQGKFNEIEFRVTPMYAQRNGSNPTDSAREYGEFLQNYLGHLQVVVSINGKPMSVNLLMESQQPPLLFQGMPAGDLSFTRDVTLAYPVLNKVFIHLQWQPDPASIDFGQLVREVSSQLPPDKHFEESDLLKNMGRLAPKGELTLHFEGGLTQHAHYQIRLGNADWIPVENAGYSWVFKPGANRIEVRSVSRSGLTGPTTRIGIRYE